MAEEQFYPTSKLSFQNIEVTTKICRKQQVNKLGGMNE